MRIRPVAAFALLFCFAAAAAFLPQPAEARCKQWTASHNGTDLFYPEDGGAAGTAANKLVWQVEQWKKDEGIENVRIGKISTSCGDWFMKYFLPHKRCVAKARVCY